MSRVSLTTRPIARSGDKPLATVNVGEIEILTLSDGHLDIPAAVFPGAPAGTPDPVRFGANLWMVRTGERVVLIDTGSGTALKSRFPDTGNLLMVYELEHLNPKYITDIVITHMHADHIGGLVEGDTLLYPKVTVHIAQAEWDHWTDPTLLDRTPDDRKAAVTQIQQIAEIIRGQVQTHDADADLGDGLSLVPAPGHTPGHSAVRVTSLDTTLMILGDALVAGALQFTDPAITYALDSDPAQAAATRQKLLSDLADAGTPCAATHLPYPGVGYVVRDGSGFTFTPLS